MPAEQLHLQERCDAALRHYEAGYTYAEQIGLKRAAMQIAYSMGELYEARGDKAKVPGWYQRAQVWAAAPGHRRGVAMCEAKLEGMAR